MWTCPMLQNYKHKNSSGSTGYVLFILSQLNREKGHWLNQKEMSHFIKVRCELKTWVNLQKESGADHNFHMFYV
jgi:hypothetical protein